tara:strand:- start:83 stop:1054 length:972 start_codon:yes stop_codon:yes gene_type:complete
MGQVSYGLIVDQGDLEKESGSSAILEEMTGFLGSELEERPAFPYSLHVGIVGLGSGVYLGDGWVLTSAHVGCHSFTLSDGSSYGVEENSWTVLESEVGGSSDLALFKVRVREGSSLSELGEVAVAESTPDNNSQLILAGTGFIQQRKPATLSSNGEVLAVIGYRTKPTRGVSWGLNRLNQIVDAPVETGEAYQTRCITTEFNRSKFEAQAAAGDSGGAIFAWSSIRERWELAGCIIAVTQKGEYVPFGSRTYSADLAFYQDQMPGAELIEFAGFECDSDWWVELELEDEKPKADTPSKVDRLLGSLSLPAVLISAVVPDIWSN